MDDFERYLNKQLERTEFKKEWDALEQEYTIIQAVIDARKFRSITQKQLAERTGIQQSDISRIERGTANPSLNTLKRLADGMDMDLQIKFIPRTQQP